MLSFASAMTGQRDSFGFPCTSCTSFSCCGLTSQCLALMFRSRGGNACCNLLSCVISYLCLFSSYFPFVVCCFSMSNLFSTRRSGITRKNRGRWSGGQVRQSQQEANDADRIQHNITSGADPGGQSKRDSGPGFSYLDTRATGDGDPP